MISIAVIIPFFQRERGILRRTLESVLKQRLSPGMHVDVIVVDDGSPVPAHREAEGLAFDLPFGLTIIAQANSSVATARNTGLDHVPAATRYIAFLDSDDVWHEGHLEQAIKALERGNDFYFCDNKREGHHESHFRSSTRLIMPFIERATGKDEISLTREEMTFLLLREFPSQLSTTVFRREFAQYLRFNAALKHAGEDIVFLLQLTNAMQRCCFSPEIMVNCETGINIYFNTIGWDSTWHLAQKIDRLRAHYIIRDTVNLSPVNKNWNDAFISTLRKNVVFHILRRVAKNKGKFPAEVQPLAREDKSFKGWFMRCAVQVAVGKMVGAYRPT